MMNDFGSSYCAQNCIACDKFMPRNVYCRILTGILPKCIAFLIGSQHINDMTESLQRLFNKLHTLKKLMIKFYNYTYVKETTNDIVKELMTALKGKHILHHVSTGYIN